MDIVCDELTTLTMSSEREQEGKLQRRGRHMEQDWYCFSGTAAKAAMASAAEDDAPERAIPEASTAEGGWCEARG